MIREKSGSTVLKVSHVGDVEHHAVLAVDKSGELPDVPPLLGEKPKLLNS